MPGAVCTRSASAVSCMIGELPSGATFRLTVQVTTQSAGSLFASANVSTVGDGDFTNNNTNATAWIQAERDIELKAGPSSVDLAVGAVYEVPYTLRSRGPLPTANVALTLSLPSSAVLVDAIDAGGAACTSTDLTMWRCELGSVAAGATRVVRLRIHGTRPVTGDLVAVAMTADDGYTGNNNAIVQLRIDHLVDVSVSMASGGSGLEDTAFAGQVSLRSNGRQSAIGAVLIIDLHAAGMLRSVAIHNGAACALLTAQQARCALPTLPRNAQVFVDYSAEFAEPGDYEVSFKVSTPGDSAPDNDFLDRAILVRPYNDIAVTGSLGMASLFGGQLREKTFTVTTDRRPLASARFVASHSLPGLSVEAISASTGDCQVDAVAGGICEL
jgi:hypothetical protein